MPVVVTLPPDAAALVGRFLGSRQALEVGSRLCKHAPGLLATVDEVVVDWGRAFEAARAERDKAHGALTELVTRDEVALFTRQTQQAFWRLLGDLWRARPYIRRLLLCGVDLGDLRYWERALWDVATDLHGVVGLSGYLRGERVCEGLLSLCCDERVVILDIAECRNVESISVVAACTALERIYLWRTRFADLKPLASLGRLERIGLSNCELVRDLAPLAGLSKLKELAIDGTRVESLAPLGGLCQLEALWAARTPVADAGPLAGCLALLELDLAGCVALSSAVGLRRCKVLVLDNTNVVSIAALAGCCGALEELNLASTLVADLSPLAASAPRLRKLNLSATPVEDLAPLAGHRALTHLDLSECHNLVRLCPLAGLESLTMLYLWATPVVNLAPLGRLTKLRNLGLSSCANVSDLAPLALALRGLEELAIDNTSCTDLSPLAACAELRALWLHNTDVADVSPLAGLASLRNVWLQGTQVSDFSPIARDELSIRFDDTESLDDEGEAVPPDEAAVVNDWAPDGDEAQTELGLEPSLGQQTVAQVELPSHDEAAAEGEAPPPSHSNWDDDEALGEEGQEQEQEQGEQ